MFSATSGVSDSTRLDFTCLSITMGSGGGLSHLDEYGSMGMDKVGENECLVEIVWNSPTIVPARMPAAVKPAPTVTGVMVNGVGDGEGCAFTATCAIVYFQRCTR